MLRSHFGPSMVSMVLAVSCSLAVALSASEGLADGASIYAESCASCHGDDGAATTPVGRALGIPSFKGSTYTRDQIAAILTKSKSHAAIGLELGDADLVSLVAAINELAKKP